MTSPALWLVRRELAARARRVVLAGAVVAAVAASVTATELVARGREGAVAAQVDSVGPALTVVPRGTLASALARYELAGTLPSGAEADVRRALGARLRSVERRAVLRLDVAGAPRAVVGVEGGALAGAAADGGTASVGSELGRQVPVGARIALGGRELTVARVLPSTGSAEDVAVFLPIETLRALGAADGVTELRLFLAPGVPPREAEPIVRAALRDATVIRTDRGDVADGALQESLARHRAAAYAILAAVAALTLLIASHLDAAERRVELATLVAIGASRRTVLGGLVARSGVVAVVGASAGAIVGALVAGTLAAASGPILSGAAGLVATVVAAGVIVGVVSAGPTALVSAARDPVRELQET